jgi:hypothetical protein
LLERTFELIRSLTSPSVRVAAAVMLAITVMVVVASGGCSNSATPTPVASASSSTVSPSPTVMPSGATPTPTATPPPQLFVSMDASPPPTTDPVYGVVSGYGLLSVAPTSSPQSTSAPSQVITVPENETIAFLNFDRKSPHTASLLTPVSGSFPPTFNNNNGASSFTPQNSSITTAQFSTGTIPASAGLPVYSFMYNTGSVPAILFIGDFFDYQSNPPFRTVIIIQ